MKLLGLSLFLLVFTSCTQQSQDDTKTSKDSINLANALLPEEKKRELFNRVYKDIYKRDERGLVFKGFYTRYYPFDTLKYDNYKEDGVYLYWVNEELINPKDFSQHTKWLRVFIQPAFELPFSITLEKQYGYYSLTYKAFGKTYTQIADWTLLAHTTRDLDTNQCATIFNLVNQKGFYKMKQDSVDNRNFLDPSLFICEGIDNGRYNKLAYLSGGYQLISEVDEFYMILELMKLVGKSRIAQTIKQAGLGSHYGVLKYVLNDKKQVN